MREPQARKRFGQNFLHDPGVIARIIREVDPKNTDQFVEIGPGRGAITESLARAAGQLDVIEIDRDLTARLRNQPWAADINIHLADALEFDFSSIAKANNSLRMIGNLPYNISTPLLFRLLEQRQLFQDMHVMLQKEVVIRMTAAPNNRDYGRLTVALAVHCSVESLFTIGPGAFQPAPRVESAFARLTPHSAPLLKNHELLVFDKILRGAFGQRRKQLGNALREIVSLDTIRAAGIDPQLRAENLDVTQYIALATQQSLENNHQAE